MILNVIISINRINFLFISTERMRREKRRVSDKEGEVKIKTDRWIDQ